MIELVNGRFYWIRLKSENEFIYNSPEIVIGRYSGDAWVFPIFNLCGSDEIFRASDFDVLCEVMRPAE